MKKAISIDEQVALLQERCVEISDDTYAKSILLEIGYYRLGFYLFPFEKTYPSKKQRTHEVVHGTNFGDIVDLYYADMKLRELFMKYISMVEICFRTRLCYYGSMACIDENVWFASERYVSNKYVDSFDSMVYNITFKKNEFIDAHHKTHINDKYAPAWKTIEFMTFGATIYLYKALKSDTLKKRIAQSFGIQRYSVLINYLLGLKTIRNKCAHGAVLYDISLPRRLKKYKPLEGIDNSLGTTLYAVYLVLKYLLDSLSGEQRGNEFENEMIDFLTEIKDKMSNISNLFLDISKLSEVLNFVG